jgi:hypothetical protein
MGKGSQFGGIRAKSRTLKKEEYEHGQTKGNLCGHASPNNRPAELYQAWRWRKRNDDGGSECGQCIGARLGRRGKIDRLPRALGT